MADHLEEQEQIDAIKKWWNKNWYSVVFPLLAVVLAYGGWSTWQHYKVSQAERGSKAYEAILAKVDNKAVLDSDTQSQVLAMASALAEDQRGSLYGNYASLLLAKLAMDDEDPESAAEHLQMVIDKGANEQIILVAKSRLARLHLARGTYDEALALVEGVEDSAFVSSFAEIRGDIYAEKGDRAAATQAYQQALDSAEPTAFTRQNILQLKLNNNKLPDTEKDVSSDAEPSVADEATP